MSDEILHMCGSCHVAWDLICFKVRSNTPLFAWIEMCHQGGCDPTVWDYVDAKTGQVDLNVPPPEYVPGLPRTDMHKTNRPGPYRKEGTKPKPRKTKKEAVTVPADGDGWSTDW